MKTEDILRLLHFTYWADHRSKEVTEISIRNSKCYGILGDGYKLIGFARVITDYATTYYLCDVVIDPEWRHRGLGTALISFIENSPEYQGLKGFLITRSAHKLYERFGYKTENDKMMVKGLDW